MDGDDVAVAEPHAIHGTCLEVLGKDVEAGRQVEHELTSLGLFEVNAHASLVEVVAEKRGANGASFGVGHGGQ